MTLTELCQWKYQVVIIEKQGFTNCVYEKKRLKVNIIFEKAVVTLSRVYLMRHFEETKFIFKNQMKSGVCYFSLIVAETTDASFKPIL